MREDPYIDDDDIRKEVTLSSYDAAIVNSRQSMQAYAECMFVSYSRLRANFDITPTLHLVPFPAEHHMDLVSSATAAVEAASETSSTATSNINTPSSDNADGNVLTITAVVARLSNNRHNKNSKLVVHLKDQFRDLQNYLHQLSSGVKVEFIIIGSISSPGSSGHGRKLMTTSTPEGTTSQKLSV